MSRFTLKNIRAWFEGTFRYRLYYSVTWGWLMRKHIREQIDWRISIMDRECYVKGQCKLCGCMTTALQMAKKQCDGKCYPKLVNSLTWAVEKHYWMLIQETNPILFYKDVCGQQQP